MGFAYKISEKFKELEGQNSFDKDTEYIFIKLSKQPQTETLIAIDKDKKHHFMIKIGKNADITIDTESDGIRLVKNIFENQTAYIDIVCEKDFNFLFNFFLETLFLELNKNTQNPNHVALSTISKWRSFFKKGKKILSEKKILGLIGELTILENLIKKNYRALGYWTGPDGERFDFFNGIYAIEVKSTGKRDYRYKINGEYQLVKPTNGELYFSGIRFEKVPDNGITLYALISRICSLLPDSTLFFEKLNKLDLNIAEIYRYDEFQYQFFDGRERIFLVDEKFPKITPNSFKNDKLPPLTEDIEYSITLNENELTELTEIDIEDLYKKFVKGV